MFNTFTDRFFHGVNKKNAIVVNSATLKGCISTSRQKVHSKSKPKTIRLFQSSNLTSRRSSLNNTMRSSTQCDFFKSENQFVPPPPSSQNNNQSRKKKHVSKTGYQFGPPMTSNQLHTLVQKHSNKNQNLEQDFHNQDQQNKDSAAICSLKDKLRRKIEMNAYKKYANAQHNYSNKRQQKVEQKHIRHLLEMMKIKNNQGSVQIQKQICLKQPVSLNNEQQYMEQNNKAIYEVSKINQQIGQKDHNLKEYANMQQKSMVSKTQEQFGRLKKDLNERTHQPKTLNMQVHVGVNEDTRETEIQNRKKIHPGNSESLNSESKIQRKNANTQMSLSQNEETKKKLASQKSGSNKQYKEGIVSKETEKITLKTPNTFWNSNIDSLLDISSANNKRESDVAYANEKMIQKGDQKQIFSATNIVKKEKEQLQRKRAIPNHISKPKTKQNSDSQIEEIQIEKKKEVNPRPQVRGKEKEKQEGKEKGKKKDKENEKEAIKQKRGERQLPVVERQKTEDHEKNSKQSKTQQNMMRKEETMKVNKNQIKQQQQYTYDDITGEVEYVFYVTNEIVSICKTDKDFIKEGQPEQICRLSKLSSYYVWQQIYFIKQYSLQLLLDKQQDFFQVPKTILRKPEFRRFIEEQVGELEKEIEKVKKIIQKCYGEMSNLLPSSEKPLNIKKQINYHKKCMSSLQQYFTQIEKQYRKSVRGNNIKESRYVQKLCEIIQMVCQLKFLNGEEIKQYQQLRQIQNYTSHYQQFKHFVVL